MKIGAIGHIKVLRITLKSGAGKSSVAVAFNIAVVKAHLCDASITIHTNTGFSTKRLCDIIELTLR